MIKFLGKISFVAFALIALTAALAYFSNGFLDGYLVEVAGVALELAVVYLFINKIIDMTLKKRHEALKVPVMKKLREQVSVLHILTFEAFSISLSMLSDYENRTRKRQSLTDIHDSEHLKLKLEQLNNLLAHASSHIPIDVYGRLLEYIDYIQDLIFVVGSIQRRDLTINNSNTDFNVKWRTPIRKQAIERAENFYNWLKENAEESTKLFFKSPVMKVSEQQLLTAEQLLDAASKLESIKLEETPSH